MRIYRILVVIFILAVSLRAVARNEVSCEIPASPEHGTLRLLMEDSLALYLCDDGRKLVGASVSKCLITGQWTSPPPKCVSPCVYSAVSNGSIGYPTRRGFLRYQTQFNAFPVGKTFEHGETAIFRCNGFTPVGSSQSSKGTEPSDAVVTCKDGQWSPSLNCKPGDCTIPLILNGQIEEQIVGPSKLNWWKVKWERKVTYRKVEVGSIPPQNATLILVCDDRYSVQGTGASSGTIECSEGRWTRDPACSRTVTCPQHVITKDFTVKYTNDRRVNSTASFNCTAPLVLIGQSTLRCLQTGEWDHLQPNCQNSSVCGPPLKVEGTLTPNLDDPQPGVGTVVTYRCLFGYVNHDSKGVRSVCVWDEDSSRAKWTKPNVGCVPRSCGEPGFVPNAHRIGNLFNIFDKVEFQCQEGYKLNGSSVVYCRSSGAWSERLPTCEPVTCPQLEKTEGIRIKYIKGRRVNSTATFNCTAPFVLHGQSSLQCLQTGKWNYLQPICRTPGCRIGDFIRTAPKNLLSSMEDVTGELQPVGSELSLFCKRGWVLAKGKKATCGTLGTWNFGKAQCVVGCHLNVENKQSKLIIKPIKEFYRFGESVIVTCPVDFQLTSDVERVVCVGSQWSDAIPNCQKILD